MSFEVCLVLSTGTIAALDGETYHYLHNALAALDRLQVAQLTHRNSAAAAWVSFGWVVGDGVGQTILCTKPCWCEKTKSIDLLQDTLCFCSPVWGLRNNIRCLS